MSTVTNYEWVVTADGESRAFANYQFETALAYFMGKSVGRVNVSLVKKAIKFSEVGNA